MKPVHEHAKKPSYTKKGPGRYHNPNPAERTVKQRQAGAFGKGLRNAITQKQAAALL